MAEDDENSGEELNKEIDENLEEIQGEWKQITEELGKKGGGKESFGPEGRLSSQPTQEERIQQIKEELHNEIETLRKRIREVPDYRVRLIPIWCLDVCKEFVEMLDKYTPEDFVNKLLEKTREALFR